MLGYCVLKGESQANGNGPTPAPSPPGSPKKGLSRSSSPQAGLEKQGMFQDLKKSFKFIYITTFETHVMTTYQRSLLKMCNSVYNDT